MVLGKLFQYQLLIMSHVAYFPPEHCCQVLSGQMTLKISVIAVEELLGILHSEQLLQIGLRWPAAASDLKLVSCRWLAPLEQRPTTSIAILVGCSPTWSNEECSSSAIC